MESWGELGLEALTEEDLQDGRCRIRLLLELGQSGAVIDRLEREFASGERFHLLLLPIEAALPRPEEPTVHEKKRASIGARRVSREELYTDMTDMSRLSGVFVATVVLSSVVAAVGMLRNSATVIVGAMVIAPLLGPNVSLAFGTTLGDAPLIKRSLNANMVGFLVALGSAVLFGLMLDIDPSIESLRERTVIHLSDIVLALVSGCAGALALTSGIPAALVGVMVAVALLPPTVAVGIMLGGGHWIQAANAALLLAANIICVNLAGVLTFLAQGVRPLSWWEAPRARRATWLAIVIWTVLLVVLTGLIFITATADSAHAIPPRALAPP